MNDTPRTDDAEYKSVEEPVTCMGFVDAEFARVLERHLNAANELIIQEQLLTNDPHALWDHWLRGSVTLPAGIGDVREHQERIKRLEEAGSEMQKWLLSYDEHYVYALNVINNWNKAKESK